MIHDINPQGEPNVEGMSLAEQEQYDHAIADHRAASEGNEQFVMNYIELAVALADRGNYDRAIDLYNMMIQLNPDDAMLYRARGGSYDAKGEYEQAIADYGEATRLDPRYSDAMLDLADAWRKRALDNDGQGFG